MVDLEKGKTDYDWADDEAANLVMRWSGHNVSQSQEMDDIAALLRKTKEDALTEARKLPKWKELAEDNRGMILERAWSPECVYEAVRAMVETGIYTDKDLSYAIRRRLYIEMRKDEERRNG